MHTKPSQQAAAAGVELTRSREDFIYQPSAYKPLQGKETAQQYQQSSSKDSQADLGSHSVKTVKTVSFSRLVVDMFVIF
jgi:hypothetical protein